MKITGKKAGRRFVIVDDHPMIRDHLALVLQSEPTYTVVGFADSVATGRDLIDRERPDLAIIDLSLRGSHGLDLIKDLKYSCPEVLVLVLSMQEESVYAQRALDAGARGYITKQAATEHFLGAVRHILGGGIYLSPAMSTAIAASVNPTHRAGGAAIASLSDRELQVFELLGRGMNVREIGERMKLSPKTIETYRERIKSKLEFKSPTDLRQAAIQWVASGQSTNLKSKT